MSRGRLTVLDGMRGVAAVAVLLFHLAGAFQASLWLFDGTLAVDFFFCLSGFVLARAHGDQLADGRLEWRRFMALRAVRLGPMLALGTMVGALCLPWQTPDIIDDWAIVVPTILLSLLAIPFSHAGMLYSVNETFWSLLAEWVVNLGYGLLHALRRPPPLALAALACAVPFAALCLYHGTNNIVPVTLHGLPSVFVRAGASFFVGVLVERAARRLRRPPRVPGWLPPVVLLVLLGLPKPGAAALPFALACIFVVFPLLILLGATAVDGRERRLWAALGDASFPLYALHSPVALMVGAYAQALPPAGRAAAEAVSAVAFVLLALAVARWVETPARAWLRRRLLDRGGRRRPHPAAAAAALDRRHHG